MPKINNGIATKIIIGGIAVTVLGLLATKPFTNADKISKNRECIMEDRATEAARWEEVLRRLDRIEDKIDNR